MRHPGTLEHQRWGCTECAELKNISQAGGFSFRLSHFVLLHCSGRLRRCRSIVARHFGTTCLRLFMTLIRLPFGAVTPVHFATLRVPSRTPTYRPHHSAVASSNCCSSHSVFIKRIVLPSEQTHSGLAHTPEQTYLPGARQVTYRRLSLPNSAVSLPNKFQQHLHSQTPTHFPAFCS